MDTITLLQNCTLNRYWSLAKGKVNCFLNFLFTIHFTNTLYIAILHKGSALGFALFKKWKLIKMEVTKEESDNDNNVDNKIQHHAVKGKGRYWPMYMDYNSCHQCVFRLLKTVHSICMKHMYILNLQSENIK